MTTKTVVGQIHVSLIHGIRLVVGNSLSVLSPDEADDLARALTKASIDLRAKQAALAVIEAPDRPVSWS